MSEESFFGALDLDEIPEAVETGTYLMVVSGMPLVTKKNGGKARVIKWVIKEEDSEFYAEEIQEWLTIYPEMTQELYEAMPAEEKKEVRDAINRFKKRMRDLGFSDEEINAGACTEDAVTGKEASVKVIKSKSDDGANIYVNVREVTLTSSVEDNGGSFFS